MRRLTINKKNFGSDRHIAIKLKFMKKSTAKRGLDFSLTAEELKSLLRNLPSCCPCCHQPYQYQAASSGKCSPHYPSFDRFDNARGYCFDNIRIICAACNQAKGNIETQKQLSPAKEATPRFRQVRHWMNETWTSNCIMGSFGS